MDFLSDYINSIKKDDLFAKHKHLSKSERIELENDKLEREEYSYQQQKNRKRKQREYELSKNEYIPKRLAKRLKKASLINNNINNNNTINNNNNNIININNNLSNGHNNIILGIDLKLNDDSNKELSILEKMKLTLTEEELVAKFRYFNEPIKYFGETYEKRIIRLRKLQLEELEKKEQTNGQKNVFNNELAKEVDSELDQVLALMDNNNNNINIKKSLSKEEDEEEKEDEKQKNELQKQENNKNNKNNNSNINNININTNKQRKKGNLNKYDLEKYRNDFNNKKDFVLYYFKRLLYKWEKYLSNKSDNIKLTSYFKDESKRQKQTRLDIKPLFKKLKCNDLSNDLLDKLEKIAINSQKGNFIKAKEIYLEMSIGNAPWPMGVTMVGIHERSNRSKIFSSQIAHIMNDETQRKYIHALQRLLTFAQKIN